MVWISKLMDFPVGNGFILRAQVDVGRKFSFSLSLPMAHSLRYNFGY